MDTEELKVPPSIGIDAWSRFLDAVGTLAGSENSLEMSDRLSAIRELVRQKQRDIDSICMTRESRQPLDTLSGPTLDWRRRRSTDSSANDVAVKVATESLHTSNIDVETISSSRAGSTGSLSFLQAIRDAAREVSDGTDSPLRSPPRAVTTSQRQGSHSTYGPFSGSPTSGFRPLSPDGSRSTSFNGEDVVAVASMSASSGASTASNPGSGTSGKSEGGSFVHATTRDLESIPPRAKSQREEYFRRFFPAYRKLFLHPLQPRSGPSGLLQLKRMAKSMTSALSPNTRYAALCSASSFWIYRLSEDFNDTPTLLHCIPVGDSRQKDPYMLSMNDFWLAVASDTGKLWVYNIETGSCIYQRSFHFSLRALDVSIRGSFIASTIVGLDKISREQQPMIALICTNTLYRDNRAFENADVVTFTSPYRDPINTLTVSQQETSIVCSTDREARFFIISLTDLHEPRLLLRSMRKPAAQSDDLNLSGVEPAGDYDTASDFKDPPNYEGITSVRYLPNNRYLVITSNVPGAAPVILDTKLATARIHNSSGTTAHALVSTGHAPSIVMRIEKLGSSIHNSAVSPRGNAIAFLDTQGLVYVMNLPLNSSESRKVVVSFDTASAPNARMSAAMKWSQDGTALLVVDRKGILHIADFAAGLPSHAGVTKARILG